MNEISDKKSRSFFGQPFGLLNLFSTEVCERFSYYGMKAILIFFLYDTLNNGGLGLSHTDAMMITTLFGSFIYLSSVIGGWIADRILGQYRCVIIGGAIIAAGHIVLGLPLGVDGLLVAIVLLVLGTGLLKPNVSTLVGGLYEEGDERVQSGFAIYYFGINVGSFFSPIIVGYAQRVAGYHVGFLIPAVVMIIGLVVFTTTGKKLLAGISREPSHPLVGDEKRNYSIGIILGAIVIALVCFILSKNGILTLDSFSAFVPFLCVIIVIAIFASIFKDKKLTTHDRRKVGAYIPIFIALVAFFTIYDQQFSTIPVTADTRVFDGIGSFKVPASWYQSVNPLVILIGTPFFAYLWDKLGKKQPKIVTKMAIGMVLASLGMFILGGGYALHADGSMFSPVWPLASLLFSSVGEILVSPVSLAASTQLAPERHASKMMSLWMISDAVSQAFNAFVVKYYNEASPQGFFFAFGVGVLVVTIIYFALKKPVVDKLTGGIV
ncbi:MAG: oligopeptide:H+ symporter [Candidatus Ancillula sp.]|jgi:POT family proton-dependent oligopeptide transporter|nr:oligopeptide:H+ symporter [Candidatus Ancillula sp.]